MMNWTYFPGNNSYFTENSEPNKTRDIINENRTGNHILLDTLWNSSHISSSYDAVWSNFQNFLLFSRVPMIHRHHIEVINQNEVEKKAFFTTLYCILQKCSTYISKKKFRNSISYCQHISQILHYIYSNEDTEYVKTFLYSFLRI